MIMTKYRRPAPKSKATQCGKCGRDVYAGLDGYSAALPVVVDAAVLTRDAELVYIVTGVKTYGMNANGQILCRTPAEVLKHSRTVEMHRVHDCATPTPEEFMKPTPPPTTAPPTSKDVPF
jgi:hypothetical protein